MNSSKRRELLISLRESKGWTQREVAEKLGISTSRYGMYELGTRTPAPHVMKSIADLFNHPMTDLFFDAFNNKSWSSSGNGDSHQAATRDSA